MPWEVMIPDSKSHRVGRRTGGSEVVPGSMEPDTTSARSDRGTSQGRPVFHPRNPPHQNLGKPPIPGPGITPSARGCRRRSWIPMGSYRLRRVLRSMEREGAVSFDSRTIEAPDLDAAIREVSLGLSTSGSATVESVTLSRPTGEIVWTSASTSAGTGPAAGS